MRLVLALLIVAVALASTASAKLPPPPTEAAVVATGAAPCGLAAHGGELWIGVYETGELLSLDRAGQVQRRIRVGRYACRVAVDGRAIWVTRDNADQLVRVDRTSGRIKRVAVSSPFDVTIARGAVWVTSFETGTVTRVDPATGHPTRVHRIGGHPTGIALCGGKLWVGQGRGATWLTSLDPRTGRSSRVEVVVPSPGWPRCLRGDLWVVAERWVVRLASKTGELLAHFRLGGTSADTAAAPSATLPVLWTIWVTDKERSVVHRIDPRSNLVLDSFPAGPGAFALARFAGSMWVTSFAGSDVRRYDP